VRIEGQRDFRERAGMEPGFEEGSDRLAGAIAIPFVFEVEAEPGSECADRVAKTGGFGQAVPLHAGQADDHQPLAVERREVAAKGAVEIVALPRPVGVIDHDFGNHAEIAEHRQRHVLQRQANQLAIAGHSPMPFGGEQTESDHLAADEVPGRKDVVHHLGRTVGPGHHGQAHLRVQRVIDLRTAVTPAGQVHHDQILAMRCSVS
jgi:hypothetical protein